MSTAHHPSDDGPDGQPGPAGVADAVTSGPAPVPADEHGYKHLIGRIAAGDESALGALYDAFVGRVHALSTLIAGDADAAAVATRETFVSVWRHAHTYDADRTSPLAWVLGMARATGRGLQAAA